MPKTIPPCTCMRGLPPDKWHRNGLGGCALYLPDAKAVQDCSPDELREEFFTAQHRIIHDPDDRGAEVWVARCEAIRAEAKTRKRLPKKLRGLFGV